MNKKYIDVVKKSKWFFLAMFLAGFFSNKFVSLMGFADTALNTTLVTLGLLIIPTIIFIVQNKGRKV